MNFLSKVALILMFSITAQGPMLAKSHKVAFEHQTGLDRFAENVIKWGMENPFKVAGITALAAVTGGLGYVGYKHWSTLKYLVTGKRPTTVSPIKITKFDHSRIICASFDADMISEILLSTMAGSLSYYKAPRSDIQITTEISAKSPEMLKEVEISYIQKGGNLSIVSGHLPADVIVNHEMVLPIAGNSPNIKLKA